MGGTPCSTPPPRASSSTAPLEASAASHQRCRTALEQRALQEARRAGAPRGGHNPRRTAARLHDAPPTARAEASAPCGPVVQSRARSGRPLRQDAPCRSVDHRRWHPLEAPSYSARVRPRAAACERGEALEAGGPGAAAHQCADTGVARRGVARVSPVGSASAKPPVATSATATRAVPTVNPSASSSSVPSALTTAPSSAPPGPHPIQSRRSKQESPPRPRT